MVTTSAGLRWEFPVRRDIVTPTQVLAATANWRGARQASLFFQFDRRGGKMGECCSGDLGGDGGRRRDRDVAATLGGTGAGGRGEGSVCVVAAILGALGLGECVCARVRAREEAAQSAPPHCPTSVLHWLWAFAMSLGFGVSSASVSLSPLFPLAACR